ncbi:WPP domain-interacting protein [Dorcoceras hygrometricum]|uniref:WPP domain-interacting protein n=1 Tax=Dorcoceras hygrometricum TaxID=472368 RepID=A0A2Z7CB44_9LAMI|nr:WPP domain-interacting protein [Dorcoceras hygrometricum]
MKVIFLPSGIPFKPSNKNNGDKGWYHLLNDIVVKLLIENSESFDVVTAERLDDNLVGTVRGRPSWSSRGQPDRRGHPSWFTSLEQEQLDEKQTRWEKPAEHNGPTSSDVEQEQLDEKQTRWEKPAEHNGPTSSDEQSSLNKYCGDCIVLVQTDLLRPVQIKYTILILKHPARTSMFSACFVSSWIQQPAGTGLVIATRIQCLAESCVLSFDLVTSSKVSIIVKITIRQARSKRPKLVQHISDIPATKTISVIVEKPISVVFYDGVEEMTVENPHPEDSGDEAPSVGEIETAAIEEGSIHAFVGPKPTCAWLRPDSQGIRHFNVGGGRFSLIRSTTGIRIPSSVCTRRSDEFDTNGISSSRRSEQVRSRQAAAGGGAWVEARPRGELGGGAAAIGG